MRQASIEGGAAGTQPLHQLPPPPCCQDLNVLFLFIISFFLLILNTCHSSQDEPGARLAACSSTG